MKAKKQVAEIVKQDIKEAVLWYNREKVCFGAMFLKEIKKEVNRIVENPLTYEVRYATIRIAFLKKFPYGIHFEYLEIENQVDILAVFHTSRNPENWKDRI